MPHQIPWIILLLPFLSLIITAFILRPFFNHRPKLGGYVTITAIGIAFALSLWVLAAVMGAPEHKLEIPSVHWLTIGEMDFSAGLLADFAGGFLDNFAAICRGPRKGSAGL